MRYEIVIDDTSSSGSTPWQASVFKINPDTDRMEGQVRGIGYGSTPQAAASAAVDDWLERQGW